MKISELWTSQTVHRHHQPSSQFHHYSIFFFISGMHQ